MRIALLSDIHGNHIALTAVLEDVNQQSVDRIVCLGDVATLGPAPVHTLKILKELKCPCILGNHDAFLLDEALIHTYTEAPEVVAAVDWCRDQLSSHDLNFLREFIPQLEIDTGTTSALLLYHGSPSSNMEEILATTPGEELDSHIQGSHIAVMAGGHTHIQMLRQHQGVLMINPGSVGYPFKEYESGKPPTILGHAEYAIVDIKKDDSCAEKTKAAAISVSLHRVTLDISALKSQVENCDYPLQHNLLVQYDQMLDYKR